MAEIDHNLDIHLGAIDVLRGEADNILSAALRDASTVVLEHVTANWPVDTGTSLAGWRIHKSGDLSYSLVNDVDYTSWVWIHPNQGGPPPLWQILTSEAITAINEDVTTFLSDRVLDLLDTP